MENGIDHPNGFGELPLVCQRTLIAIVQVTVHKPTDVNGKNIYVNLCFLFTTYWFPVKINLFFMQYEALENWYRDVILSSKPPDSGYMVLKISSTARFWK